MNISTLQLCTNPKLSALQIDYLAPGHTLTTKEKIFSLHIVLLFFAHDLYSYHWLMYLRGTRKISWVELLTGRRLRRDWSDSGRRSPHVVLVVTLSCWHRVCVFLSTCVWVCTTREFFGQQVERLHPIGLRQGVMRTHWVSTCMRSIRGDLR